MEPPSGKGAGSEVFFMRYHFEALARANFRFGRMQQLPLALKAYGKRKEVYHVEL